MAIPFRPLRACNIPIQIILIFLAGKICSQEQMFILCSNNSYASQSSYETSLHRLLTFFIDNVPKSDYLYLNGSSQTSSQNSRVYGLAQCSPDLPHFCSNCLAKAVSLATNSQANGGCWRSISVASRLDRCLLLYSDQPDLVLPEWDSVSNIISSHDSASVAFADRVKSLTAQTAFEAAKASSRFATKIDAENEEKMETIYVLAWCRLDSLGGNCTQCLQSGIDLLLMDRFGGQVQRINCFLRFAITMFFNVETPSLPSSNAVLQSKDNPTTSIDDGEGSKFVRTYIIPISEAVAFVLLCTIFILICLRRKKKKQTLVEDDVSKEHLRIDHFVLHGLGNIRVATNNFSENNKLGEGGFGAVYKGVLRGGQEIAVKRLSKTSLQGIVELKNEVAFVARLQHRNLVRLIGCCLEKEEKLLVYEFLSNKSLDKFLFDPVRRAQLDWGTRYKIIEGIAQGLVYLHEDSRLRVVHCDLKASNILLDCNMNPKISDFGYAKLFGLNEIQGKTREIAGTQGYMAPEYALQGLFSAKSDVYSYGVLVLETITGLRSVCLDESVSSVDLQSYVAENWKQGQPLQAVDPSLGDRYILEQVLRCIQIGLLCIQEDPARRPSMTSVVVMLSTSNGFLPEPVLPAFLR